MHQKLPETTDQPERAPLFGIPPEAIVFRLDESVIDLEVTSDGSFQHVEMDLMDTFENMYTAETEEVPVVIPIPDNLVTEDDREAWRIQNRQSLGERNRRQLTRRVCLEADLNRKKNFAGYAEQASRIEN